jgi:soluble lytic murein transglycosylase-like protein
MPRVLALALIATAACQGGEYALLSSGATLHVERHEQVGSQIRLFTKTGSIDLPADQITGFEIEEPLPPSLEPSKSQEQPSVAPPKTLTPKELVQQAADRHGLPASFVHLVARAESGYKPNAVSPKGAVGIMQLMPATAASLGADPSNPEQNVEAGTRLLRDLLAKYENYPDQLRRALAAYNAGSGAVDRYNGVPPYRETQSYVEKIVSQYKHQLAAGGGQ